MSLLTCLFRADIATSRGCAQRPEQVMRPRVPFVRYINQAESNGGATCLSRLPT